MSMKGCLIEDYSNPALRALTRSVLSNLALENKLVPFPFAFDSLVLHFKHWTNVVFNPKARSAWKTILEKYYETDAYKRLNEAVYGNEVLSRYATIAFLNSLIRAARDTLKQGRLTVKDSDPDPVGTLVRMLDDPRSGATLAKAVPEVVAALEREAERILEDVEVAKGFSHFGAPIARLLEKPDEFRNMVGNRIVVHLVRFLNKLRSASAGHKLAKLTTLARGRPLGVKRMQRWSELPLALPAEHVDDSLLDYRIATRTLKVYEQYGGLPDYVVYLDRSGSMAGGIRYCDQGICESVPKISFAAASALALAHTLRRYGKKMTLKLFDVEVHKPVSDFVELVKVLLTVQADSGTNISKVLEDAMAHHRDEKVIVVTDGIDEVDEEVAKAVKSLGMDVTFVFIDTDNILLKKYFSCVHLREARPAILLEV